MSKAGLKSIKAHLDKAEYRKAADEARDLTRNDSSNYLAFLFLGKACEELNEIEAAEKALQSANSLKPQEVPPLKGAIGLYEKQGNSKLEQYHQAVFSLAKIYADQDDREKCADAVNKYELYAKKHGSQQQYRYALELLLPTSPLFPVLEGRVMQPALAYQRILESSETEEKEWVKNQIADRRTRLGARLDQVTAEVKYDAIRKFEVEQKYTSLINWTQDDTVRWELEQKRFQRMYDDLLVLPLEEKPTQRDRVLDEANGMVTVDQPFVLAWRVVLDWLDEQDLKAWRPDLLEKYIDLFPEDGLTKVLKGFRDSKASTFPAIENASENGGDNDNIKLAEADQLILISEGLADCPESLLAHMIGTHVYLVFEEYQSAVEIGQKAQQLHKEAKRRYAVDLQQSRDGVTLDLATALIYYQSPRHHAEAKTIFESILSRKPKLTNALLGIGLIYEDDEDWVAATNFLSRAAKQHPGGLRIRVELAWCRALTGDLRGSLQALEDALTELDASDPIDTSMKAEVLYRIAYCKWNINPSPAARKDRSGPYKDLVEALKVNKDYAPAYTLLGIYFQDYGKSKTRARSALHRAFELSTSELVAAERLAKLFASNGEWDLVELVAQRVISSGKAKPAPGSKKKALSWPDAAMGIVQMNKQQFSKSIIAFQAALRIDPNDYNSWVGLGESYHNSGRYVAAAKVFQRAAEIGKERSSQETWFAKYMQGNVEKEVGAFDNAIEIYRSVLTLKHDEYGVLLVLLQTYADDAWAKISRGLYGAAAASAGQVFEIATKVTEQRVDVFNLWKAVGDACSAMGHVRAFANPDKLETLTTLLRHRATEIEFKILSETDGVSIDLLLPHSNETSDAIADRYLIAAILSHKRSIHASFNDIHAQAVAWYNLGWAEQRAWALGGSFLRSKGQKPRRFLKTAMRCFKQAIELEASNAEFWNALGLATMTQNPQIAQHSFVRSLNLNEHSARTWSNIGVLYLLNNDAVLANEAFTRAQSTDPEFAEAWVGQAMVAMLYGNVEEARALLTHAFEIADATTLSTKRQYSSSAFDHLLKTPAMADSTLSILQPLFAAGQLHELLPANVVVSHLLALFAERIEDFETATKALQEVCDAVEIEYESKESDELLVRFAQAKADLARVQLGNDDFEGAVETAEMALDLSSEGGLGPAYAEVRGKLRLSAHMTAGLAYSHLKAIDQSIKMFQSALSESPGEPDIICMLAQVLWAKGGQQEQAAARSQLFDCAENNPEHVQTACLLATMGLADKDEEVVEAMKEELAGLRLNDDVSEGDKLRISKVLAGIREQMSTAEVAHADATASIMLAPSEPQGWLELFEASGDEYAAEQAKDLARRHMPPHGTIDAEDMATFDIASGKLEDVQQAAMFAPWMLEVRQLLEV